MQRISEESFTELMSVMERVMDLSIPFKPELKKLLYEKQLYPSNRILNFREEQMEVWFLLSGALREIREDKLTLKEKTSWFWLKRTFAYAEPGFFSRERSERAIEVVVPTKVVFISYGDWAELKANFEETEKITELIRGANNKLRTEHMEDMQNLTTDERYLDKEEILDYLFPRTQLNYLADYMRMAPDTLSKLRKKFYNRKR